MPVVRLARRPYIKGHLVDAILQLPTYGMSKESRKGLLRGKREEIEFLNEKPTLLKQDFTQAAKSTATRIIGKINVINWMNRSLQTLENL